MQIGKIAIITFACVFGAAAQDKITVPLTNPAQPATVKMNMISGGIRVIGGSGRDVVVTSTDGENQDHDTPPQGMKRIGGRNSFSVEEDHNVVTIAGPIMGGHGGNMTIEVPVNTSLQLRTINGAGIEVTGVNGDLEIQNTNGSIKLTNVSGSVVAHTLNGAVTVSMDRIAGNKPMSFTSMNGVVDVTLPSNTKARLRLKSDHGNIYSDFDVRMESDSNKPVVEDTRGKDGKYKISIDRAVTGTINGGGPEYTFQTMNGNILIHKK
jgi:hypothetical protein